MTLQPLGDVRRNVNIPLVWRWEDGNWVEGPVAITAVAAPETDLGVDVTVTVREDSLIKITAQIGGLVLTAADGMGYMVIYKGAVSFGGQWFHARNAANQNYTSVHQSFVTTQTAAEGAVTYHLKAAKTAGTWNAYFVFLMIDVARA